MLDFEITYYKEHIFCVGGTWGVGAAGFSGKHYWKLRVFLQEL